ncbi:polysaccharide lyase [Halosquirtibacter xylanolyticus]|uniref:heparin lyase I family protein n=1 Tax=Halosquirtibacter xylanolyticus TaxID=3374599 RepID=UPI003748AA4E|nr:polysaccharide lyase [Prolixibacteraceae bacterium]
MNKSIIMAIASIVIAGCSKNNDEGTMSISPKKPILADTAPVFIDTRQTSQTDIALKTDVIDNMFMVIGSGPSKATVSREVMKGTPIYHFNATGAANRIEFTTCYGTPENLKGISTKEIENLKKIKDLYRYSELGDFGQTISYRWSAKFPENMGPDKGGIFAQWHGRPDRCLFKDPKGNLHRYSIDKAASIVDTVDFVKNIGYSKKTGKPNGWGIEQSAGGPIGAFHFREDYMYLIIRTDANRMSNPQFKIKPRPGTNYSDVLGRDGKFATIVYQKEASKVPINKWIDFRVDISYSKYDPISDNVIKSGGVKVWIDGKLESDWKGDVGKNDKFGPFFKFGIYKPKPKGFKVDCKSYEQIIL